MAAPTRHPSPHPGDAAVLCTADEELAAAVQRIAAAAGCASLPHRRTPDPGPAPTGTRARLLLVGADVLTGSRAGRRLPSGTEVVVLSLAPAPEDLWQRAADAGACHVAVLPEAEAWLLERLADLADHLADQLTDTGQVVGVVGGCGGAGASVLASALAGTAAARGSATLLVDGDPLGGGLDLLLGAEDLPGLRWADLLRVRGRLRADVLHAVVAPEPGLHLLSWGREASHELPTDAVESVLSAARRSHELTVWDLPARPRGAGLDALAACDEVLLVVPARVRAAAAARRVAELLAPRTSRLRLVVRGPAPTGLDADALVEAVGVPLAGDLAAEKDLDVAVDRGEGVPQRRRSPLRAWCEEWHEEFLAARALAGAL
ncbi:secretion/DNA translocation related CpaE-like protein [Kineococcus xinjiangensis]|uniref:Secretion/DNA translocation related CpaE-like protein n=1 Tax=Kineococcus xinjiangensis TaxID=512762 RepID=A0A2S6IFF1_9ACTN|nr:septum site-determining protein Ssd [Kineococcus xinjiangensis]PPK92927.1 secretion/DNA translocation related CpaE-like protein [Kineococcus xinjiangensis]